MRIIKDYMSYIKAFCISLLLASTTLFQPIYAGEMPKLGNRYKIISSICLSASYYSLNDRQIKKETARAYLEVACSADTAWVAFQNEIPAGTIMTIVGSTSKVWPFPFFADRYLVRLEPDPSQGLDVVLELDRGIEGRLDGLNPEIFQRVH